MKVLRKVVLCGLTTTLISTTCLLLIAFDPPSPAMKWKYEFNTKSFSVSSETFVPQNPCTKIDRNQLNFLGKRLAKCATKSEPIMMTAHTGARLGNQMFLYAALFAISRYNDRKAWMSPSMSNVISKYFNVSSHTISPTLYSTIKWRYMHLSGQVPPSIRRLGNDTHYLQFLEVPQVRQYFEELRPLILKEFRFYDHIVQNSKSKLLEIKRKYFEESDPVTIVGIHVRRGDYLKSVVTQKYFMPTVEYYVGAMRHFTRKYQNVIFVVASNDVTWCMENLLASTEFHMQVLQGVPEENGGLDMATLAHCDHVIYGLGTFGFWTGYLSTGEVIFCSDCITKNTGWLKMKLVYNGDYGNSVLPSWIGYTRNGTQSNELAKTTDVY